VGAYVLQTFGGLGHQQVLSSVNVEWSAITSINVCSKLAARDAWWSCCCGKLGDQSQLRKSITKHQAVVGQRQTTHSVSLSLARLIRLGNWFRRDW